jgi:hypothetical protein
MPLRFNHRTALAEGLRFNHRTPLVDSLRFNHLTLTPTLRFNHRTAAAEPEVIRRIQITSDGNYLVVTLPRPLKADGTLEVLLTEDNFGNPLPQEPTVYYTSLEGENLGEGVLMAEDPNDWAAKLVWKVKLGVLPYDGVFIVHMQEVDNQDPVQEHVLVSLRLQLEEARQLLLPKDDYNEAAADLETWISAATLVFEHQQYEDADYILRELTAALLTIIV